MSLKKFSPKIPHITKETKRFLKIKTLWYLFSLKNTRSFLFRSIKNIKLGIVRIPLSFFKSKKEDLKQDDLFFYRSTSLDDIKRKMKHPNAITVIGISYCQKAKKCPVGRFNDLCNYQSHDSVCQQCSVGVIHQLNVYNKPIIIIPTFIDIAEFLINTASQNPHKEIVFVITACELSLTMFGSFSSLLNLSGVGVRLSGRICNTMKAFKLAEEGIKPGETFIKEDTLESIKTILSMN